MKFIDIHARMVDVDTTHLLSIYTGAIKELYRIGVILFQRIKNIIRSLQLRILSLLFSIDEKRSKKI